MAVTSLKVVYKCYYNDLEFHEYSPTYPRVGEFIKYMTKSFSVMRIEHEIAPDLEHVVNVYLEMRL